MIMSARLLSQRGARFAAAAAVMMILGLAGCYPGGPESTGDLGVVVTLKDPEANFQGLATYGMEDVVHELDNPDGSSTPIDPQFDQYILDALQSQMAAAGFTRIMAPDTGANKPDVWLSVGAVESEVWVYYYGWGGYPGYGWGGYYPSYVGTASYMQGTVVWQMFDIRNVDDPTAPGAAPPVAWLGVINGALNSSASATEASITTGINQGFAQSPYIAASASPNKAVSP